MGKYKYEFLHFFARDYRTYEQHFKEMAQKGYFIENINGWLFKYRKGEPQNLIYSFDFNEAIHELEGAKSKNNKEYRDFIEASGWKHVLVSGQINLFMNKNIYASSLHSDELLFYKTMDFDKNHSRFTTFILPALLILVFLLATIFGWSKIMLSNSMMLFVLGVLVFTIFSIVYRSREYYSLRVNKKLLQSDTIPEARSFEDIKTASFLSLFECFSFLPLLVNRFNLGFFIMIIIITLIAASIFIYMKKSKHNYVINGMILVATVGLIIFLAAKPIANGLEKDNKDPNLFLPGHIERVIDYKQSSSIFVNRYDNLEQEDSEGRTGFDHSIIVSYIDSRYDFITDLLFNDYMHRFNITEEHRISHSHYGEVYETYSLNKGNVYIKYEIILIKQGNKIVFIKTSNKDLFDVEGIIEDCMSIE